LKKNLIDQNQVDIDLFEVFAVVITIESMSETLETIVEMMFETLETIVKNDAWRA
jgi:hypothetical protein